ncbi:hypothetical protein JDV02_002553 [Purpureocillium takamizusanense]|uniref:Beta-lactamase-related domain-containing protein n=1 Tax=Purpureocillium takamizusanense TaxID=2060973 RepID=A0A9Q8QAI5_9HYPO|nr:uncharacterized protein JDV02_002553 [Purpureocillium takamizusanense]UNI16080.1 hypothetical protein JDV02_002553 [Purpureocillium takamizusanense]
MEQQLNAILNAHVATATTPSGTGTHDKLLGASFAVVAVVSSKEATIDGDTTPSRGSAIIPYAGSAGRIGFGFDHDQVSSAPFAGASLAYVASLTKLVTTTCLMQLVERGVLSLDQDVRVPELADARILRGFDGAGRPVLETNTTPITMLLTHTAGLGYDLADPALTKWSAHVGRRATNLDWSRPGFTTPLSFAPGSGWCYGTAIDWAGLVLEAATGQTLGEYMQTHIFAPLGMRDTGFWPEKLPQTASRAVAFSYRDATTAGLEPGPPSVPEQHDVESGGAGLYTTADDYARFLRGLLAGELVSDATLDEMLKPQLNDTQREMLEATVYRSGVQDGFAPEFPTGLALNHGLGGVINMEDVDGKRRKGSMMWSGACNSHWWIDRESGIAAVLIVNVQPHGDAVAVRLYDELERAVYAHLVRYSI